MEHHKLDQTIDEQSILEDLNLDETFTNKIQLLNQKQFKGFKDPIDGRKRKLTEFETYVALIKAYCALLVLLLPKAFSHGGFVFSPICVLVFGAIQTIAGIMLVRTG